MKKKLSFEQLEDRRLLVVDFADPRVLEVGPAEGYEGVAYINIFRDGAATSGPGTGVLLSSGRHILTAAHNLVNANLEQPVPPIENFDEARSEVVFHVGLSVTESESNDTFATADVPPLGFLAPNDPEVRLNGSLGGSDTIDYFAVQLQPGDIFGAAIDDSAMTLSLFNSSGVELRDSATDESNNYPDVSPLPRGDDSLAWVVDTAGTYYLAVENGTGDYELTLGVYRPELEYEEEGAHQILFLDFNGETIDAAIFGAPSANRTLSPITATTPQTNFLDNWDLLPTDANALIDKILATVTENFSADTLEFGDNADFNIEIRNSRDHADPFGQPNVSRVIIGGTSGELPDISSVGKGESIDIGNFDTTETAVVLLDQLSGPGAPNSYSLNQFTPHSSVTKIDLVGVGIGNIVSHEAGHLFGNSHTNPSNSARQINDASGGNVTNIMGVVGTEWWGDDEVDVDFGSDDHWTGQAVAPGIQNSVNQISYGLTTGRNATRPHSYEIAKVMPHPDYLFPQPIGNGNGFRETGGDLGIIELREEVVGIPRYDLYRAFDEVDQVFTRVGYGEAGNGIDGSDISGGRKRAGQNTFDGEASQLNSVKSQLVKGGANPTTPNDYNPGVYLISDFDNGDSIDTLGDLGIRVHAGLGDISTGPAGSESQSAPGDSGGPLFIGNKIAGLTSHPIMLSTDPTIAESDFGEIAVDTRVSVFAGWIDAVTLNDAPQVIDVIVGSSGSAPIKHKDYSFNMGTYVDPDDNKVKRAIGSGGQLATVPVGLADVIKVRFDKAVNITTNDLNVIGLRKGTGTSLASNPQVVSGSFQYDSATFTASWEFDGFNPLGDQYLLKLSDAITDAGGTHLDGDWVNPARRGTNAGVGVSTFPSGNGTAGGDFEFVLTLMPGDVNLDQVVNVTDLGALATFWQFVEAKYEMADFNGDGVVNATDLGSLATNWQQDWTILVLIGDDNGDWAIDEENDDDDLDNMNGASQTEMEIYTRLLAFVIDIDVVDSPT